MKRVLDQDSLTNTTVYHDYDHSTGLSTIAEVQDVQPNLELAKSIRNHGSGGAMGLNDYSKQGIKKDWWHVASVPNSVIVKWKRELGVDIFNKHQWIEVQKLLNSPDYAYLRTGTGRV